MVREWGLFYTYWGSPRPGYYFGGFNRDMYTYDELKQFVDYCTRCYIGKMCG